MEDSREQVQERFGEFAQRYVNSSVHSMGYSLDRLIELVAPQPGQRALDIATGGGHVALQLAKAGAMTVASDLTSPMLDSASKFIRGQGVDAQFVRADAQHLPFVDNSLDIVTCRFAAHHFPDAQEYVRECARVVKLGGLVALMDHISSPDMPTARYSNAFQKLRDPSHVWEYSEPAWQAFFTEAGLRVRDSETFSSRLDFPWWTQMQNNDADTVMRLRVMLAQAPQLAKAWLDPQISENGAGSFALMQLILVGVKE